MEKQFRQCALKKNQESEIWMTEHEDLCMKLEDLGSSITDNQFMIHILNNMTSNYDLQLEVMKKRINDKVDPLTIDEIRDDLHLSFERWTMKENEENMGEVVEELTFFLVILRENAEIVGPLFIRLKIVKNKTKKWWKLRKFTKWHLLHLSPQIGPFEEELF
jgi:hypothetical protein